MRVRTKTAVLLCAVPLFACGGKKDAAGGAGGGKKITIGLAMDTLKEARWNRDRDLFVQKAEELGARVLVQSGVIGDIAPGATVWGTPARPHREVLRGIAALYRLAPHAADLEALTQTKDDDAL